MNGRSSSGVTVTGVYSNSIPDDDIQKGTLNENSTSYIPESSY